MQPRENGYAVEGGQTASCGTWARATAIAPTPEQHRRVRFVVLIRRCPRRLGRRGQSAPPRMAARCATPIDNVRLVEFDLESQRPVFSAVP